MLEMIIEFIKRLLGIKEDPEKKVKVRKYEYRLKSLMSKYEVYFYNIFKELPEEYVVLPQVNLASIVEKKGNYKYRTELFRNIDFAVFTKDLKTVLLLIEINDKTHNQLKRKDRDLKVQKICNDIGVDLMKFYSMYPNEKNYVLNRINTKLIEIKSKEKNNLI